MGRLLWAFTTLMGLFSLTAARAAEPPGLPQVRAMLGAAQEPVRIVCFGDSVTGVYYHTCGRRAWTDMLGIALGRVYPQAKLELFNAGISGNNTSAALDRLDRDVLARKPHLVVVMFGLNDIVKGDASLYRANLKDIVERCHRTGAVVVLCTPNSVQPNADRPLAAVGEYSQMVRKVAQEKGVPVADCFQAYEAFRAKDATQWLVMMSDEIHPGLDGHKLFAETISETISGQHVSLADVRPPADALHFTLEQLKAGQPVKVIAMPPYDQIIREALAVVFPRAKVEVTPWPVEGQSLEAIMTWGKRIREQKPNLVVMAVPAGAEVPDDETFIRQYHWVRSWSVAFGQAQWDLLSILPGVTGPLSPEEARRAELARQIIGGGDVDMVARSSGDTRTPQEILVDWIHQQTQ